MSLAYRNKSGSWLPTSLLQVRIHRVPYLVLLLLLFLASVASGQVAIFESRRLTASGLISEPEAHASSLAAARVALAAPSSAAQQAAPIQANLLADEAKRSPPVYKSAPKHVSEISELGRPKETKSEVAVESGSAIKEKGSDLSTAAGSYKKKKQSAKKKKYKVVVVKKKKKRTKKKKKGKKKKVKKVVIKIKKVKKKKPKKHYKSASEHQHHGGGGGGGSSHFGSSASKHSPTGGEYYEYMLVPKKGAWEFGFKRGNKKHAIERKEKAKKWQFRTEVKWTDKKGKGHHVFDYNHDKGKHHHAAGAASTNLPLHKASEKGAKKRRKSD